MENMCSVRNHFAWTKSKRNNWLHTLKRKSSFWWTEFGPDAFQATNTFRIKLKAENWAKYDQLRLNCIIQHRLVWQINCKCLFISSKRINFFPFQWCRWFRNISFSIVKKVWEVDPLSILEFMPFNFVSSYSNKSHNRLKQLENWMMVVLTLKCLLN